MPIVRSRRVVFSDGVRPATIHIRDGVIARVGEYDDVVSDAHIDEAGDAVVMPGVVDSHVHVNEPGRTGWEGFETATRAAAAGGVTTIVDMPLNSIPATTTVDALEAKRDAAKGQCFVDVGFWGGVVPGNAGDIEPLYSEGVLGFKCFLVPSGVDEFPSVTERDLRLALPILRRLRALLLVHAEVPEPIESTTALVTSLPRDGYSRVTRWYSTYLATRPPVAELAAIELMIALARDYGTRTHIVHLSSADSVTMLDEARATGVPITVETCPHYLTFAAEDVPDGATTFKCAPPVRERANREALWRALTSGSIQLVASDHSPAPPAMKHLESGDFLAAWGGISPLQLSLPATWTGASARGGSLTQLAEWMCAAPARLAGLSRKGTIAAGRDADLVVWDPEAEFVVDASALHHRHAQTPYDGMRLRGVVLRTYLRGRRVYERGTPFGAPAGISLRR